MPKSRRSLNETPLLPLFENECQEKRGVGGGVAGGGTADAQLRVGGEGRKGGEAKGTILSHTFFLPFLGRTLSTTIVCTFCCSGAHPLSVVIIKTHFIRACPFRC